MWVCHLLCIWLNRNWFFFWMAIFALYSVVFRFLRCVRRSYLFTWVWVRVLVCLCRSCPILLFRCVCVCVCMNIMDELWRWLVIWRKAKIKYGFVCQRVKCISDATEYDCAYVCMYGLNIFQCVPICLFSVCIYNSTYLLPDSVVYLCVCVM